MDIKNIIHLYDFAVISHEITKANQELSLTSIV